MDEGSKELSAKLISFLAKYITLMLHLNKHTIYHQKSQNRCSVYIIITLHITGRNIYRYPDNKVSGIKIKLFDIHVYIYIHVISTVMIGTGIAQSV
jgi:hypothetical protein